MNIVFLGSSDFGLPALERLIADGHRIVGVVSTPDRPKGRGLHSAPSPVSAFAHTRGLTPVLTPEILDDPVLAEQLQALNADLFVVIAYRILPERIFALPSGGTVNVHASLLPRYRGPAPIQRAIENGETETGVTVFRIDRGIDTGGVLFRSRIGIAPDETSPSLYARLSVLGAETLSCAVTMLQSGTAESITQDDTLACRAPKLRKEEGRIDWSVCARTLYNRIRAFKPFPSSYAFLNNRRVVIEWGVPIDRESSGDPGTILAISADGIDVACGTGVLRVTEVKPEGRSSMSAAAFARGNRTGEGVRFE